MKGWFGRWRRKPSGQDASYAHVGRDLYQLSSIGTVVLPEQRAADPTDDDYEAACTAYAKRLRERYGRLDLEVLTPLNEQGEHPVVGLREVFVPQSVRADPPPVELPRELLQRLLDAGAAADGLALPPGVDREVVERVRQAYDQRPARPVLDVVADPEHERIVVLGDPGAGKSTLARYLALALTADGGPVAGLDALHGRLPLVVELRVYAEAAWRDRTFEDFLGHLHEDEGLGLPPRMLAGCLAGSGPRPVLVVFDGLDELFEPGVRDAVARRIAGFAAKYPSARIIVTSRRVGYQRAVLDGAGFADFLLQDLDRQQIETFTRRWFALACPDDQAGARRLEQRVLTAVDGSASVRSLAGNPLILTILAIIGRRRELPRDRKTVYEHAVAVLVEHWDLDKFLKDRRVEEHLPYLGTEDKLELLRLVARRMQEGEGGIAGNHIARPDLIDAFEGYLSHRYALSADRAATAARIMVDQFRYRNFILSRFGGEVYGFVHRTFLEYLAATDLAHRFQSERSLSEEELYGLFVRHWQEPAWHEILLLLTGLLDERFAGRAIDRVLRARPFGERAAAGDDSSFTEILFAAECLAEVRRPGLMEAQTRGLVTLLVRTVEVHRHIERVWFPTGGTLARTGAALRVLGPDWPGLRPLLDWYVGEGQHRLADSGNASPDGVGEAVAGLCVSLMLAPGQSAEPVVAALTGPEHTRRLRSAALRALFRPSHGKCTEQTLELARRLATDEGDDQEISSLALNLLAEESIPESPVEDALDLVRWRAVADPRPEVRTAALRLLTPLLRNNPYRADIDVFLRARAREEETEEVAMAALAGVAEQAPDAFGLLVRHARHADSADLRRSALTELYHLGRSPLPAEQPLSKVRGQLLRERAVKEDDPDVRAVAVGFLAQALRFDSADAEVLLRLVVHDEDPRVRAHAVRFLRYPVHRGPLARSWSGKARGTLLDHVAHDDASVRAAAVRAFGELDDVTLGHLLPYARGDASPAVRAAVLSALHFRFQDEPEAWAVLAAMAVGDSSPEVRRPALRYAALGRPDAPEAFDLLADRAAHDPDEGIRSCARDLLDALRPEPPQT
ncbi:HEAT repeat domain-containing protein [Streptomyces sp. NPDC046887]|uniref:HEAT repeat domain-containing protein n=1 Tax=Streptomyces sp. NPDC046887 TaxID=3155472 RepID=UPI0033F106D8